MAKPISFSPFQKFNNGYQLGTDPYTFLHLLSVKNFSPSSASSLRQINEWAFVRDKGLQLFVNHPASCGEKSVSHTSDVDQILPAIITNDDRIDSVRSSADDWR